MGMCARTLAEGRPWCEAGLWDAGLAATPQGYRDELSDYGLELVAAHLGQRKEIDVRAGAEAAMWASGARGAFLGPGQGTSQFVPQSQCMGAPSRELAPLATWRHCTCALHSDRRVTLKQPSPGVDYALGAQHVVSGRLLDDDRSVICQPMVVALYGGVRVQAVLRLEGLQHHALPVRLAVPEIEVVDAAVGQPE